jgi:hypothetical protein
MAAGAIASFASSHERFLEFACRLLLAYRQVSFEGVNAWWKEVSKQSERQMGSFVALWIADFRSPPPLLSQKLVELRNACVHKGRIPPESEAKAYGEGVLRSVVGGIVTLRNRFDSELEYDDFVGTESFASMQVNLTSVSSRTQSLAECGDRTSPTRTKMSPRAAMVLKIGLKTRPTRQG